MKFAAAVLLGAIAFTDVNAMKIQDLTTPVVNSLVQAEA